LEFEHLGLPAVGVLLIRELFTLKSELLVLARHRLGLLPVSKGGAGQR
jgi:hypothetical protein